MTVKVVFADRENLTAYHQLDFGINPKQYSWNVFGGPEEFTFDIDLGGQSDSMLWSLSNLLRCGVHVYDWRGVEVWWGYVHEIRLYNGTREYGISIETMFNRVRTTYELIAAGATTGVRADTAWQSDARSITVFGTREKNYSMTATSDAVADADVLTRLERTRVPAAIANLHLMTEKGKSIEVTCRGWWYTLDDLYYANAGTTYTALEDQLVAIIESGDFIAGTVLRCAAAALGPEFRLGDNMIRDEAEKLMNIGTDNSRRILATVTRDRFVELTEEPAKGAADYYLDKSNNLIDNRGNYIEPAICKVGQWAVLRDFEGISYSASAMIPPSPVFIERAIYDCKTGVYQPEQRGYKSPYEEMQMNIAR